MEKLIVNADKGKFSLGIKELLRYRDLFLVLAYRDLKVRYAQTFLGFLWAFIKPACTLLIFTLVFGKAVKVDTGDVPYPVFALSGMVLWTYFSYVMSQAGNSIIGAQEMVKKIYFPRLIIPLSKAFVGFVDFGIAFVFLILIMIYYSFIPSPNILYALFFVVMGIIAALSIGIWLSALTIRYRDFQHIVPFLVQFGLYATPVGYPVEMIPKEYLMYYYLNPMAGIVQGFRWALLGGNPLDPYAYLSFALTIILFVLGLVYFKKVERVMADIV